MDSDSDSAAGVSTQLKALVKFAVPVCVSNLLMFSMVVEDQILVGQLLSSHDFAAAALASGWFNMSWYFLSGMLTAVDTLAAQAHGAGHQIEIVTVSLRGALIGLVMCAFVSIMWLFSEPIFIHIFQQDEALAGDAATFVRWLIPGLPCLTLADTIRRYYQAQGILFPAIAIGVIANVVNVITGYLLIKHIGFIGAPLSTTLSRLLQLVLLLAVLFLWPLPGGHHPAAQSEILPHGGGSAPRATTAAVDDPPVRARLVLAEALRRVFQRRPLLLFLRMGLAGGIMLSFEAWAFEITIFLAGTMGSDEADTDTILSAHFALLTVVAFSFIVFPLSISIASAIRVGHLLGEGRPADARLCAWLAVGLGAVTMVICGAAMACARGELGRIFSDEQDVIDMVSDLALIGAAFQLVDGIQGTAAGALRGCGWQHFVAGTNALGFWALGIPCGCALAFGTSLGVYGIWWGLTVGLSVAAVVSTIALAKVDWEAQSRLALKRALRTASDRTVEMPPGIKQSKCVPPDSANTAKLAVFAESADPVIFSGHEGDADVSGARASDTKCV